MADGKSDLELRLKATGGSQSAAEVRKLEEQLEETREAARMMREALDSIEGEGPEFDAAMARMEAAVGDVEMKVRRADAAMDGFQRTNPKVTKATGNTALGFLEVARAVEDAQYGFRGVVNNIPQMIMLFGGGAGLAGAVSIAAVAISQLLPLMEGVSKESDEFAKAQDRAATAAEGAAERIKRAADEEIGAAADQYNAAADARIERLNEETAAADRLLLKQAALRSARSARIEAEKNVALARLGPDGDPRAVAEIERQAAVAQDQLRVQELRENVERAEALLRESEAAVRERQEAAGRSGRAALDAAAAQQQLANNEARLAELEGLIQDARRGRDLGVASGGPGLPESEEQINRRLRAAERLAALRDEQSRLQESLPGQAASTPSPEAVEALDKAAEKSRELLDAARAEREEREKALELEREISAIREETITFTQGGNREVVRDIDTARAVETQQAEAAKRAMEEAEAATAQAENDLAPVLDQLQQLASEVRQNGGRSERMFAQQLLDGIEAIRDGIQPGEIEALAGPLQALTGQVQTNFSTLYQRMDELGQLVNDTASQLANLEQR